MTPRASAKSLRSEKTSTSFGCRSLSCRRGASRLTTHVLRTAPQAFDDVLRHAVLALPGVDADSAVLLGVKVKATDELVQQDLVKFTAFGIAQLSVAH